MSSQSGSPERLTFWQRRKIAWRLSKQRFREYLEYDSVLFRFCFEAGSRLGGRLLKLIGQKRKAFSLMARAHRSGSGGIASRSVTKWVRESAEARRQGRDHPLLQIYRDHVTHLQPTSHTQRYFDDPTKLLPHVAMVLKSPSKNEKGILFLCYSYVFPLFAHLFDLEQIAENYHLVLEPSWNGYCDLDILFFLQYSFPVYVETSEPKDEAFLQQINANLRSVPLQANWWTDIRLFHPSPEVEKDIDIILLASWARFKRHAAFFSALSRLKKQGETPRVALLGYPTDCTKDDILRLARYYDVEDLIEAHEWLPPEEVQAFLARSKVHVLWSRREGCNRAILEAMSSGVPTILRAGFNYGEHYAHINEKTGRYATEKNLPETLLDMIRHPEQFASREWVLENMTPQHAARILGEAIKNEAKASGEIWTRDLVTKVVHLHGLKYWDEEDNERFAEDYAYLRSMIRSPFQTRDLVPSS